ncbi:LysR family transcriptional regulator [Ramlibacter sp. AW1]|uniref:LysR family transcriptional regulator n=1 Tax=Ramlibacter aurantiacus TaxID=2801330 RepID=A0A936ZQV5_9BURK|nr:LysR family transcriptional regulator [Ramlibacter aurantiacus]MBL0421930.1 LysR family transcriptional regulator [Ramlibacter aurantiacus]
MSEFDHPIQLSDLRALMAVLRDGTVTSAAQGLGLTQSALSYQLDRMRKTFGDQLFVRVGNRMAATPFAQRLADPATRVLQIVDGEISQLGRFDPATSTRTFRLGVNEIGAIVLVPKVIKRLGQLAPRATLAQMQVRPEEMATQLQDGAMDLAAGHLPELDKGLLRQRLYRRDYTCIVSQDHPRVGETLTVRQLGQEQLLESPGVPATNRWVRTLLEQSGQLSKAPMTTHHVAAIPFIVAASELVAVVPREVFDIFRPIARVRAVRLTRAIPSIDIHQYWHPRLASDPAVRFLRELVFEVAHE